MVTMALRPDTFNSPSQDDAALARVSVEQLLSLAQHGHPLTVRVRNAKQEEIDVKLPAKAVELLTRILADMASGSSVTIIAQNEEFTTQQAADFLNVSRPFLIQLLDNKEIAFRKVGSHRRVRVEDIRRYKEELHAKRRKALDELVADSQKMGIGY